MESSLSVTGKISSCPPSSSSDTPTALASSSLNDTCTAIASSSSSAPPLFNRSPVKWQTQSSISSQDQPPTSSSHNQPFASSPQYRRRSSIIPPMLTRRRSSATTTERRPSLTVQPSAKGWKLALRPWDEDDEADWWVAGTAIPLLAATIGPLANVLSIAALVTYWRMCLLDDVDLQTCPWNGDVSILLSELKGHTYRDPRWCYDLNAISLVAGFVGNLFLLFNFTGRVRYMIALPVTILTWYIAAFILTGITISMNVYVPPTGPQQVYTQGFWYAVIAAILYMIASMLLMVNMCGYFLGHYPQQFNLTDSQRTLILQTMLFFLWLAGGAAMFAKVESEYGDHTFDWSYVNSLYFCDVTIITIGFGDIYPTSDVGRGLVFPYAVGGIIMLGLMISSITKFAAELGHDKVLKRHVERSRSRTVGRAVTTSYEMQERERMLITRPVISAPFAAIDRNTTLKIVDNKDEAKQSVGGPPTNVATHKTTPSITLLQPPFVKRKRTPRPILLREGKDRFDAMRAIQYSTARWKRWYALTLSVLAFGILWCVGAVVFWRAERHTQNITYFESLYLCYVSLLTIGYGDFAPQSNAGRPFFVVWSLVAVPTMTILVADMGETIIGNFKKVTWRVADWTVLPEKGIYRSFLLRQPGLLRLAEKRKARKEAEKRLARGFEVGFEEDGDVEVGDDGDDAGSIRDIHGSEDEADVEGGSAASSPASPGPKGMERRNTGESATNDNDSLAQRQDKSRKKPTASELARKLTHAIRKTANDVKAQPPRVYTYEEWVEFTELIRFTSRPKRRHHSSKRNLEEGGDREGDDDDGEQDDDGGEEEEDEDEEAEEEIIEWDWIGVDSPMMAGTSEAEFVLDRLCESMRRYIRRFGR